MKTLQRFLGVLATLLVAFCVPSVWAQGVPPSFATGQPYQVGLQFCVGTAATCPGGVPAIAQGAGSTSNFNVNGPQSFIVVFKPAGTTSPCTFTLDGVDQLGNATTGSIISSQSCTSAGSFATSSATQNAQAKLSYNITTTGSVLFTVYGCTSTGGCGGGVGSSVTVSNFPATQNVVCTSGCAGANPNGQALMASSAPVVIASNQSAVAVTAAQPTAANLNATVVQATGSNLHTAVDSLPALPTGANTIGAVTQATASNFNATVVQATGSNLHTAVDSLPTLPAGTNSIGGVTTQPAGFSSSPLAGQQAVTATAANLGANATHTVCITALSTNTIPVYVGGSGETTSTGFPLNAGDAYCWQVTNSNLLYVIASTTGASVAWTAQ